MNVKNGNLRVWKGTAGGFPDSLVGKESACNVGDPSSIPGLGRFSGEGKGYPWTGEFHGLYSPWGCKESDTIERLSLHFKGVAEASTLNVQANKYCTNWK